MLDSDGNVVSTTLTNDEGRYIFTEVAPGNYKLMEEDPAGYASVSDFDRSTGDNDADGAAESDLLVDNMIAVTLEAGEDDEDNDFVDALVTTSTTSTPIVTTTEPINPASISGKVTQDTLDGPPISGVTISLLDSDGNVVSTTLTNDEGRYIFTEVAPGNYKLMEEDPAGYASVSDFDRSTGDNDADGAAESDLLVDNMIAVTLEAGEDDEDNDFVDTLVTTSTTSTPIVTTTEPINPASISGKVTQDTLDGPPISGVTISLLDSDGNVVSTTLTNDEGRYIFTEVAPGNYKLMEEDPAGYASVSDFDRSTGDNDADGAAESDLLVDNMIAVTLEAGEDDEDNDFVDALVTTSTTSTPIVTTTEPINPASISGKVTQDTLGGPPISGVTISLLDSDGNVVSTTLTNDEGRYIFTEVAPGNYKLMEEDPAGYASVSDFDRSTGDNDADGAAESDLLVDNMIAVTLEAGEDDEDNDFVDTLVTTSTTSTPIVTTTEPINPASISGKVTQDTLDGPPISGVTISLLDSDGNVVSTTLTNDEGRYIFTEVAPGNYKLMEEDPAGYASVSDFDRSTGDNDADGAAESDLLVDNMIAVTLEAGEDDEDNDFVDTLVTTSTTSTPIVTTTEPINPASISGKVTQDTLDGPPISGVTISLLDSDGNVVSTTLTNDEGRYIFTEVAPGNYKLMEEDPAGYASVSDFDRSTGDNDADGAAESDLLVDNMIAVTLEAGEDDEDNDFVDALVTTSTTSTPIVTTTEPINPASISGKVTQDTLDGTPISGVTISLLDSDGNVVSTTLTNDEGRYIFTEVAPGNYKLMEEDPAGYASVSDFDRSTGDNDADGAAESDLLVDNMIAVTLEAGEDDEDNDFVDALVTTSTTSTPIVTTTEPINPASISGKVTQDTLGGPPISGVTISLLDSDGNVVSTTLTNDEGRYIFTEVAPGNYKLMEEDPAGYASVSDFDRSTGDNDADGAAESDLLVDNMIAVTLEAGEDDEDNDFVDTFVTTSTTAEPDSTSSTPLPPCGTIRITEILYDPSGPLGGDKDGEWIEIYNNDCDAIGK